MRVFVLFYTVSTRGRNQIFDVLLLINLITNTVGNSLSFMYFNIGHDFRKGLITLCFVQFSLCRSVSVHK